MEKLPCAKALKIWRIDRIVARMRNGLDDGKPIPDQMKNGPRMVPKLQ
jgi:hypothetical protein